MNNFLILTNIKKDPGLAISKKIYNYLTSQGASCRQVDNFTRDIQDRVVELDEQTQCVIVLGGDGTMLHAARLIVPYHIPMVGVNLGTVGFMAEIEPENLQYGLDCLLKDNFHIEERSMLEGTVCRDLDSKSTYHLPVLNDIAITRSGFSRILNFQVYVNQKLVDTYEADGIVVSTPTGSTGYNLSASGPVASPTAPVIIITPICPHSMTARSIVLSDQDAVSIHIGNISQSQLEEAFVTFDGQVAQTLEPGDVLEIAQYEHHAKIIKVNGDSFYHTLRTKIGGSHEKE